MGTAKILQAVLHHWEMRGHPVYVAEARALNVQGPFLALTRQFVRRLRWTRYVVGALLALIVVQFYCARTATVGLSVLSAGTWVAIGGVLIGAFFLTYLWPAAVATSVAGTIVR